MGVKARGSKAKAKDLAFKAKAKDMALKAKAKDLAFKAKDFSVKAKHFNTKVLLQTKAKTCWVWGSNLPQATLLVIVKIKISM